jgi:Iap family predicted aminopeptidase
LCPVLCLVTLLGACSPAFEPVVPAAGISGLEVSGAAPAVPRFSTRRAMTHVRKLSKRIGVRVRGTKNERRAARYVRDEFEKLGYVVFVAKFDVDSKTSRNVVARRPATIEHPFVIGAHMDTVKKSPGANDNASGVAVMLEMARILAGTKTARLVKFVGFGAEEYGTDGRHHVGSQTFVNRLGKKGSSWTPGMLSVDMVADGRPLIVGNAGIGPDVVARRIYRKLDKAGFDVTFQTTCDCSDNGPFELAGIPAAFMWSGDEPDYHSPSDTVANVSKKDLLRSGRAVRLFVKALDQALIRRFRKS